MYVFPPALGSDYYYQVCSNRKYRYCLIVCVYVCVLCFRLCVFCVFFLAHVSAPLVLLSVACVMGSVCLNVYGSGFVCALFVCVCCVRLFRVYALCAIVEGGRG